MSASASTNTIQEARARKISIHLGIMQANENLQKIKQRRLETVNDYRAKLLATIETMMVKEVLEEDLKDLKQKFPSLFT